MIKNLLTITIAFLISLTTFSQTTLTEANDFHVKTIYGEPIYLFPLLDDENKIVVIDFFSTTCGPCQDYADDFQACYEKFGYNEGNTYFMGINWGNDNQGVFEFDSIFGLTFPSASGSQGGGNIVYQDYDIQSYPTVIVITPDHTIVEQYVWYPDEETITNAVISAGGIIVGTDEPETMDNNIKVFPNPVQSKGKLEIFLSEPQEIGLKIINLMGQEVITTQLSTAMVGNNTIDFNVDEIQSGYYLVQVHNGQETIATTTVSVTKN